MTRSATACLGWDITDYGQGNFNKIGLLAHHHPQRQPQTMRDKYPKVYAEKLLFLKEGQYSPNHFHWYKTEDIINRGGGNVLIRVYNSHPDESIDYESPTSPSIPTAEPTPSPPEPRSA